MNRRSLLALTGSAMAGLAGCLGGSGSSGPMNDQTLPDDPTPDDGYPPQFENPPSAKVVDPADFATTEARGVEVPMAPVDVVYYWYARSDARFVDTRGPEQYDRSHIYGAVLSPAPEGFPEDDPTRNWPADDRILCYCGCPHHLSSLRAATMLQNGFEDVYIFYEGFWRWHEEGYPMAGGDIEARPSVEVIDGVADPGFAGMTAWATHPATGQREATAIGADGAYRLHLRFSGVTDRSVVTVETPGYSVRAPLAELTAAIVTGE